MLSATVQVAADRSATLLLAGTATQHADLAAALIAAGQQCRQAGSAAALEISDPKTTQTVYLDENGRVAATPAEPTDGRSDGDEPPAESAQTSATSPTPAVSATARPPNPPARPIADDGAGEAAQGSRETAAPAEAGATAAPGTASAADDSHDTPPQPAANPTPGYPLADRFSGPAEPVGAAPRKPRAKRSRERRGSGTPRRGPGRHITVPGIVLLVLVLIAVLAYLFPSVVGSPIADSAATEGSAQNQGQFNTLSVENSDVPVPGFAKTAAWKNEIGTDASVTASSRGVLVVTKTKLRVLDATTGKQRYAENIKGQSIDFAVDTTVSGQKALLWRSAQTVKALFDSAKKPISYKLPSGARLSSAGSSVLMKVSNKLYAFGDRGLEEVAVPPNGTTPMALDGDTLLSAAFGGPVYLTDASSGKQRKVKLESPGSNLKIIRWISAGYGNVVTLWGQPGSQTNSGHPVQLVIHDAKTGAIKSTVSTTTDVVSGNAKWVRGQGHKLAVIGRYLFDMRTGLLMRESTSQDVEFADPRGTLTPGTLGGESVLVSGDTAWKTTTNLLAVTDDDDLAIVRQADGTVVAYPKN